ncbi:magnesium transporter CorA family protein [Thauera sinica]|uniref:CorA-like Mg2+ transporter protein n=1 Tax=Thauera sinica TaxID=2665146 RepID=A0ABW1ANH8_9RHOO|nr:hypothetical protein [Thauera sp. K11]ATE61999.1 hypothetical protein CCZ27_20310 [Thauera sp. K11]
MGESVDEPMVKHFRLALLWPLRLLPVPGAAGPQQRPWQVLRDMGGASPWHEVEHDIEREGSTFEERHYSEFVTFLPYVQQFLYGEGRSQAGGEDDAGPPMRVFRRRDIARLRIAAREHDEAVTLDVVHVHLYFFFDVDVVILNVEVKGGDMPLSRVQELMYRIGRAYPSGWDEDGFALHSLAVSEWLAADGSVLARTDAHDRQAFMTHVSRHRSPRIAAHWAFLLRPLASAHAEEGGALRYRQIEYHRMPLAAYLAIDDPLALTRSDFIRLGLVTGAGPAAEHAGGSALPYGEPHLADFERRYCYDRFWGAGGAAPHTRYLCSGHALVVVGDARSAFFTDRLRGVLAQFRHQHFLLFLIAHFQKAALLTFSERLVEALKQLRVSDPASVRRFKRAIRASFEGFLRFTHRYWFHDIAEQAQTRALFRMTTEHLQIDPLYAEVKERTADMNGYLDADGLRRQANTVVRLTVVTIFGLIGTITTGFLGMNLLAEANSPLAERLAYFAVVFAVSTALTIYTMVKSKRLSDFLDAVSDERLSAWNKLKAFAAVWRSPGE